MFANILVHLVTLATSQCVMRTDKFRRYRVPENMSVKDHMTGESTFVQTAGICLLKCVNQRSCRGMVYDIQTKRCFLKECVNPHQFIESNEQEADSYIQISQTANVEPNKFLARGEDR